MKMKAPDIILPGDTEHEPPNLTPDDVPDPEVDVWHVHVVAHIEPELATVERRAATEEEQVVHELPKLPRGHQVVRGARRLGRIGGGYAQARRALPESAPAPSQDTRPHSRLRREEGEHVLQYLVREGGEGVNRGGAGRTGRLLGRWPLRHSVEQTAGLVYFHPKSQNFSRFPVTSNL